MNRIIYISIAIVGNMIYLISFYFKRGKCYMSKCKFNEQLCYNSE